MLFSILALTAALALQFYVPMPPELDALLMPAVLLCCLLVCSGQLLHQLLLLTKELS